MKWTQRLNLFRIILMKFVSKMYPPLFSQYDILAKQWGNLLYDYSFGSVKFFSQIGLQRLGVNEISPQ